jgi:hypothetical protein
MTLRRWRLAAAVILAVIVTIVAIVFIWVIPGGSASDCETVHQLIDYNQAHNKAIGTQSDPDQPSESPMSDYEDWASQLKAYAREIHDPRLVPHAEQVAALADQTLSVVRQARDDAAPTPTSGPPPWAQNYAELNAQFEKELSALEAACPA